MAKVAGNEVRPGMIIEHNGQLWSVVKTQSVKPGKGGAFVRTKIKNLLTGQVKDQTFRSGEKINEVRVVRQPFQFLYASGGVYHMMDRTSYEQIELPEDFVGERAAFLQDGMTVTLEMHDERPIGIKLPDQVTLEVVEADPVVKGQTAASSYKPAKMENGLRVMVPPFITTGEKIIVDTNEVTYIRRAD